MSNLLTIRNLVWALALGVTIWLFLHAPQEKPIVQAKRYSHQNIDSNSQNKETNYSSPFHLKPRERDVMVINNIFAVTNEKIVISRTKQRFETTAPQLPFSYLGLLIENGERKIFLSRGEQMLIVKSGELIDDKYKLIAIDKMGDKLILKFFYLPMKLTQTMVVNNAN